MCLVLVSSFSFLMLFFLFISAWVLTLDVASLCKAFLVRELSLDCFSTGTSRQVQPKATNLFVRKMIQRWLSVFLRDAFGLYWHVPRWARVCSFMLFDWWCCGVFYLCLQEESQQHTSYPLGQINSKNSLVFILKIYYYNILLLSFPWLCV